MNSNFVPKRSDNALSRRSQDGSVAIVDMNNSRHYYVVDGIRAEVWTLIDGRRSLKQISVQITEAHDVEESECLERVGEIVEEFMKEKLLGRSK